MGSSRQPGPNDVGGVDEVTLTEIREDQRMERRFLFRGLLALAAAGIVVFLRYVLGS